MHKSLLTKVIVLVLVLASVAMLAVACTDNEDVLITDYSVSSQVYNIGDSFSTDKVTIKANKSDDTTGTVPAKLVKWPANFAEILKLSHNSADDTYTFTTAGDYSVTVSYLGEDIEVKFTIN